MAWWNRFTDFLQESVPVPESAPTTVFPELVVSDRDQLMTNKVDLITALGKVGITEVVLQCNNKESFWYGSRAKLLLCTHSTMILGVMGQNDYFLERVSTYPPGHGFAQYVALDWGFVNLEALVDQVLSIPLAEGESRVAYLRETERVASGLSNYDALEDGWLYADQTYHWRDGQILFGVGYLYKDVKSTQARLTKSGEFEENQRMVRLIDHPHYSTEQALAETRQRLEDATRKGEQALAEQSLKTYRLMKDDIPIIKDGDILTRKDNPGRRWVVIGPVAGDKVLDGVIYDVMALAIDNPGSVERLCSFHHVVIGNINDLKDGVLPRA